MQNYNKSCVVNLFVKGGCAVSDCILGDILFADETISNEDFKKIADLVIRRAKAKANATADDGEALAKDTSGRNSHNVINIDDDFEL